MIFRLIAFLTLTMLPAWALATDGASVIEKDGSVVWTGGLSGVQLKFAADGSVDRMTSTHYQPVEIADRRGIAKARTIAEERAKAEMVRFIEQEVSTSRVITEVQNDISQTVQTSSGTTTTLDGTVQRQIVEGVTEITRSSAEGLLRGVIVLESGYDEAAGEVWVTVGLSRRTMGAAAGARAMIESSGPTPASTSEAENTIEKGSARAVEGYTGEW